MKINNLGHYGIVTTLAKKCGGMVPLLSILLCGGAGIGVICKSIVDNILSFHRVQKKWKYCFDEKSNLTIKILEDFNIGNIRINRDDMLTVCEICNDYALIKINDADESYKVSSKKLIRKTNKKGILCIQN